MDDWYDIEEVELIFYYVEIDMFMFSNFGWRNWWM